MSLPCQGTTCPATCCGYLLDFGVFCRAHRRGNQFSLPLLTLGNVACWQRARACKQHLEDEDVNSHGKHVCRALGSPFHMDEPGQRVRRGFRHAFANRCPLCYGRGMGGARRVRMVRIAVLQLCSLKCPRESGQLKICPPSSYPSSHESLVARGLVPYKAPLLFDAAPPAGAYPASGANMAVWLRGTS